MTAFEVYLITRVEALEASLFLVAAAALMLSLLRVATSRGEPSDFCRKRVWLLPLILLGICVAIPSEEDVAMMYVIPAISKNEQLLKLPASIVELADKKIQEMIKEVAK